MVQNWPFFHFSFLGNIGQKNEFYDILERKNAFLGYKNKKFKKSKKLTFFQRGLSMVLVEIWPFFQISFSANIGQENVFYDFLERKNAFLGYKKNKFKKSKNWHFSKGVSPWFWSKIGYFSTFFFSGNIGEENVFYDILERKNSFLRYKKRKLKRSKNWHFFKGVSPWLRSKIGHFSILFFFTQYKPRKCVLWYCSTKRRLPRL